jgi:peroxiredoxin (alkyl hydroperoxide reductase subunit C)
MEEIKEVVTLPRLGEPAPDFTIITTHGKKSLSDYRGKWVVMFSHPADFTPVCSTEFIAFAKLQEEFKQRNVQLIGLSVDSVHSHIAWQQDLEALSGIKIDYPIIADLNKRVARLYGMVHPGEDSMAAVRAVFIIDHNGILKGMIYYPLSVGRNIDEVLRFVDAAQFANKNKLATPANWHPGEPAIVPPPTTIEQVRGDSPSAYSEFKRWYLRYKKIAVAKPEAAKKVEAKKPIVKKPEVKKPAKKK